MGSPLLDAQVVRFSPRGLSDSLDETDTFEGGMTLLQDLIPDSSTENLWTCRPASVLQTNFTGFTTPARISVFYILGTYVYGMVASGLVAGRDQPFCYNLTTNAFVSVTGTQTSATLPATQSDAGDWVPPVMGLVGTRFIVCHPGFSVTANFFGWFDVSTPSAPVWHAGNTTGAIILTVVPAWVAQFNGRAWFGINPASGQPSVVFTDTLTLNVTNATQALTFGDNFPLTGAAGLPLDNQLGGVIQALLIFKGTTAIYQITGDAATMNLSSNTLNAATGTLSPRTIMATPNGVAFLAPDGLRIIDFSAHVSEPVGLAGSGVNVPFLNIPYPSRAAAACTAQVMRFSVQNSSVTNQPWQEYWYDVDREVWSGPHSFPSTMLAPYNNAFILAPQSVTGELYSSNTIPTATDTATENGVALNWVYQTVVLRDNEQMAMSEICEMQVKTTAIYGTPSISVIAQDENGTILNSFTYNYANLSGAIWDVSKWDSALWGGSNAALYPRRIDFPSPTIYNRLVIQVSGASTIGFKIGDVFIRRRVLEYMQEIA